MEIRVGKFILRSDQFCMWIEEEYQSKGKDGKPGRVQRRKVAGYTNSIDNPRNIVPKESTQKVGKQFAMTLAPYSITVLVIE